MKKLNEKIKNKYSKIQIRMKEISIIRYIKTNILFISYVLVNFINSWILRIITMQSYFNIKVIFSDLLFILFVGSFAYLLKPKKQIKILFPLTLIMTITCVVNAIYYENYVSFASFSLLSTASFLGDMGGAVVTSLIQPKDIIVIFPIVVLPIVYFILKKKKYFENVEKIERGKKRFTNTLIVTSLTLIITIATMKGSDYSRLEKQWNREYLVQRFGIYVYQFNDAIKSTESKFTSLFGYDKASKTVREFYEEKEKNDTKKENEYTNILEGKNIIVIHAESIMTHDMTLSFNGQELTPNLNKLASTGLYFSNYYPQVSVGTSSDTEFTFSTSLLPASTGTVFVNYWDRKYESIQNLLTNKGYFTASMHANNASFWNRNVMHKTLGYNKFYAKDSFDNSNEEDIIGLGLSDKAFFKQSIDKIKNIKNKNNNYYITMIMLTNHTPWDGGDAYGNYEVNYKTTKMNENGEIEETILPYMEGTELGNYFKAVHYADEALGQFINDLDENGLLENTAIVLYGDHDAKISKKEYKYFYNYDFETGETYSKDDERYVDVDYYNYELNRKVPFIIWTKDSEGTNMNKEITSVMGMYDALPTLANMLNLDYKYALGHDIFSTNDNIVVFPNGNWVTDKVYYNAQKEEYLSLKDNVIVTDEEIEKNKEYANQLLEISNSIIVYDLEKEEKDEEKK